MKLLLMLAGCSHRDDLGMGRWIEVLRDPIRALAYDLSVPNDQRPERPPSELYVIDRQLNGSSNKARRFRRLDRTCIYSSYNHVRAFCE
jgi:hypothetical protein